MAAEEDTKKLFIQVESEDTPPRVTPAGPGQTTDDYVRDEFNKRLDEIAEAMREGYEPSIPDLPSHKGESVPDSKEGGLSEEATNTIGTAAQLGAAALVSQLDSPAPGPADAVALAMAADATAGDTAIVGGGAGGGGDALAALATGDPLGKIMVGMDAVTGLVESIFEVVELIDEHILSLGDDVRAFSSEVQIAEAEAQIMQMEAMMRRNDEIGPLLGDYIRERAILDAEITDLVTELESKFLPLALLVFQAANDIAIPAIERITLVIDMLFPDMKEWLAEQRNKRNDEFEQNARSYLDNLGAFLSNKGKFKKLDKDKLPHAAGIFN